MQSSCVDFAMVGSRLWGTGLVGGMLPGLDGAENY